MLHQYVAFRPKDHDALYAHSPETPGFRMRSTIDVSMYFTTFIPTPSEKGISNG
jgi:hypothetical protein